MAFEGGFYYDESFEAAADLSAAQYKFVELDANGKVTVCNAATDIPIGVLQNKPTLGQMATVRVLGVTKVSADAALAIGVEVGTSADGQADAKTVATDATERVVGRVLVASGAAGELATITVNCLNPHRAA